MVRRWVSSRSYLLSVTPLNSKNMKKYIYILIAVLGVVTSCVTPFDPQYDENPIIYIESFPGLSADYIDIKIMPAYSKSNTPVMTPFKPEITFEVNGKALSVECINASEGMYRALYSSQPGDKMSISVASEGFITAYAETTIPKAFPERKIDYLMVPSGIDTYDNILYVTISDKDVAYGYGLQICKETIYEYPTGQERWLDRYAGNLYPEQEDFDGIVPVSLEAVDISLYGEYLWAWEGASLNNGKTTFAIEPQTYGINYLDSYDSFFLYEGERMMYDDFGNELGTVPYINRNKLLLYTMSEEFYKYRVAYEFQADYDGFIGFVAPSNYCYSNIDNGFGAFAGINVVETDWITKEFIENNR